MEQELKQRMIGVTVIVALAVIFVPMLFDKRVDKERSVNGVPPIPENVMEHQLELPKTAEDLAPKDEKPADQSGFKIIPLSDAPAEKSEQKAAQVESKRAPSATEELTAPVSEEEEFGVEEEVPAEKPRRDEPAKAAAVIPVEKPVKLSVPVEKLPEPAKKPRTVEVAVKKSEPASVLQAKPEPAPVAKKPRTVEPPAVAAKPEAAVVAKPVAAAKPPVASQVPSRATASESQAMKPQPPKQAVETPAASDVWVIQTGSFTSEAKARALAEKLRQSRFPAFVESAASDHGTTYRVQVGPELDRGRAEQTQKQIENSAGIKGIIVPHP